MKKYIALALLCTITAYAAETGAHVLNNDSAMKVFAYDPTTDTLTPLPTTTVEYEEVVTSAAWQEIGSSYYLATGGWTTNGSEANILIFNPETGTVTYLP